MDVFSSRLEQEFGEPVIITAPTVPYKAILKTGETMDIESPSKFPEEFLVETYQEPWVMASLIAPTDYVGSLLELCNSHRGQMEEMLNLSANRVMLRYRLPLSEIVMDFYDQVKSVSSGYASFDYEEAGYEDADLVKLDTKINGESVDALSFICERSKSEQMGRKIVRKLHEKIDRQNFEIIIQAAIGTKIVARERLAPYRKVN